MLIINIIVGTGMGYIRADVYQCCTACTLGI